MATNNNELSTQNCGSAPSIYSLRQAAWTLGVTLDELSRAIRRGTVRTVRRRRALVVTAEELTRHLAPRESTDGPGATNTTLDALDRYRDVPTDVLARIVVAECAAPLDDLDAESDAELAERICGACRAPLACVELELRLHGAETVGVWGGLPDDRVRALCRGWLERRDGDDIAHDVPRSTPRDDEAADEDRQGWDR